MQILSNGHLVCQLSHLTDQRDSKLEEARKIKEFEEQHNLKIVEHWNTSSKPCTKCGITKSLLDFYTDNRAKDGKQARCISCVIKSKKVNIKVKKFIYFVHDLDVNRIKIGFSSNIKNRIHSLLYDTGICTERRLLYIIPGNTTKETILHEKFKEYQWNKKEIGGREWFNNENNIIIDFIEELKQKNKDSIISKKIEYGISLINKKSNK